MGVGGILKGLQNKVYILMCYFSPKFRKVEDVRKKLFLSSASSLVRLALA